MVSLDANIPEPQGRYSYGGNAYGQVLMGLILFLIILICGEETVRN